MSAPAKLWVGNLPPGELAGLATAAVQLLDATQFRPPV